MKTNQVLNTNYLWRFNITRGGSKVTVDADLAESVPNPNASVSRGLEKTKSILSFHFS